MPNDNNNNSRHSSVADSNTAQLILLGEIKGELAGIHRLVQETSASTHRRIDDHTAAINKRVDDIQLQTDARLKTLRKLIVKKGSVAGGAGGVVAGGLFEVLKSFLR